MPLSGPTWVSQFPTSKRVEDLAQPFRDQVARFVAAIRAAGATLTIADTLRAPERAYLMHFSFEIAREGVDPASVPARAGVDIQWVHPDAPGTPSAAASRNAAEKMVQGYGIAFKPALNSRHTEAHAIDMSISWVGDLVIAKADGTSVTITSAPRDGNNASLHQVGASFGVIKLATDPPHWSIDGH
jgi:plastocyanin